MDGTIFLMDGTKITLKSITLKSITFTTPWPSSWPTPPSIKRPYVKVPKGYYRPKDLNLPLPVVKGISVGECVGDTHFNWLRRLLGFKIDTFDPSKIGVIAHAHQDAKWICFFDGTYIYSGPNEIHEAVWHEYAHILSPIEGHGEEWKALARSLGISDPHINCGVVHFGTPELSYDAFLALKKSQKIMLQHGV